jgi:hypothetical protein
MPRKRAPKKVFDKFESDVRAANMRLGEIAAKTETIYDDQTLDKLGRALEKELEDKAWAGVFSDNGQVEADDDGLAECSLTRMLARNRSVWLAWPGEGKQAPGACFLVGLAGTARPPGPLRAGHGQSVYDEGASARAYARI